MRKWMMMTHWVAWMKTSTMAMSRIWCKRLWTWRKCVHRQRLPITQTLLKYRYVFDLCFMFYEHLVWGSAPNWISPRLEQSRVVPMDMPPLKRETFVVVCIGCYFGDGIWFRYTRWDKNISHGLLFGAIGHLRFNNVHLSLFEGGVTWTLRAHWRYESLPHS